MAIVAIKLRIMPVSPETDLEKIRIELEKRVEKLEARLNSTEIEPIAFGLRALIATILWPENKEPDLLENAIRSIEDVESAEIIDVTRVGF